MSSRSPVFGSGGGGGGGKGGSSSGSAPRPPVLEPNTLQSASIARVVDLLCEGEIEGLVGGARGIYFDETPLQNDDGSYNFSGVTWEFRPGTPDQIPLAGLPSVEHEVSVGAELKVSTGPVIRTISAPDVDAFRIKIQVNSLVSTNSSTGDRRATSVAFAIGYRPDGGGWVEKTYSISGKTTSPYQRDYDVELTGAAPWEIRVRRLTADSSSDTLQNGTAVIGYTQIIRERMIYPDSALVGLTIDSRLFGSQVPRRGYDVKGLRVQVPKNYDPETREYSGLWDGTFKTAWTDNPAWCFYDIVTNDRYGVQVEPDQIDKWSLYEIARHCDELLPHEENGETRYEPRYRLNCCIQSREDAYHVLNAIASNFRGMVYWGAGLVRVAQDSPKDPRRLVAAANVVDGEFARSGSALKDRTTVAIMKWNDPDRFYAVTSEVAEDPDQIREIGVRQSDELVFGCTSRAQAARAGRWKLETEKHQTETVTFSTSWEQADLAPGDIILLNDPVRAGVRAGGRVRTPGLLQLELDQAPELDPAETHMLSVVLPGGSVIERGVDVSASAGDVIALKQALPELPAPWAMWVIQSSNLAAEQFRIVSNREVDFGVFEITAVQHDPTKYDRVELGLNVTPPPTSRFPTGPIPKPTDLSFIEFLYLDSGTVRPAVELDWVDPDDPRVQYYEVEAQPPGLTYQPVAVSTSSNQDVRPTEQGDWCFRVRSVDGLGRVSQWAELCGTLLGLYAPPGDVKNFNLQSLPGLVRLSWTENTDLDLDHYEIRFSPLTDGTADWESALPEATASRSATTITMPPREGTYLIKAVDIVGVYSVTAALSITTVPPLEGFNVVDCYRGEPWTGGKVNTETVNGTELALTSAGSFDAASGLFDLHAGYFDQAGQYDPEGFYDFNQVIDLGSEQTVMVTANIDAYQVNPGQQFDDTPGAFDAATGMFDDGGVIFNANVEAQIRTATGDNTTLFDDRAGLFDDAAGTFDGGIWSAWQSFTAQSFTFRTAELRLRLTTPDPQISPFIRSARVCIDVPETERRGLDLMSNSGPTRLTFSPPFVRKPYFEVTGDDLQPGDKILKQAVDRYGATVTFIDAGGAQVARLFDYLARGV